jgi:hypothetical protein
MLEPGEVVVLDGDDTKRYTITEARVGGDLNRRVHEVHKVTYRAAGLDEDIDASRITGVVGFS